MAATGESGGGWTWLYPLNAVVIAAASLPLILALPFALDRVGVTSAENLFYVQLAGVFLFGEAVASVLAWRGPAARRDLTFVIVAMKGLFILLVVATFASNTLPSSAFVAAGIFDFVVSAALLFALRQWSV